MKITIAAALLIAMTFVACSDENKEASATQKPATTAGAAQSPASPSASAPSFVSGTIAETMNAGGYTYVKIDTATGEQWAAVPETKLEKGARVSVAVQMINENFQSSSLNRTFDRLIFGTIAAGGAAQMPAGHPATGGASGTAASSPMEHMKGGAADVGPISVSKAEGPNGRNVSEIWSARAAMKDKPVAIRGKVVKFLPGIMGRNWIHLRDGSGSASKGDNDITITTQEKAAVGDVVLVTGVVRADKDFGSGYSYPVIIEDGKISK